jgi:hypothetical protein
LGGIVPGVDEERRLQEQARRRRHPAERTTSRFSGLLLLLVIPHAAFGYALVGLVPGDSWVRTMHFVLAPLVIVLAALLFRSVGRLPWRGTRERALFVLAGALVLLGGFQFFTGLWMRWALPGSGGFFMWHVGVGLVNALVVTLAHVASILPSILVSARREHARLQAERREGGR